MRTLGPPSGNLPGKPKRKKEILTPRKSRRSKDLSPPPLRHRQNRMPEQVALIKGDSELFLMTIFLVYILTKYSRVEYGDIPYTVTISPDTKNF